VLTDPSRGKGVRRLNSDLKPNPRAGAGAACPGPAATAAAAAESPPNLKIENPELPPAAENWSSDG